MALFAAWDAMWVDFDNSDSRELNQAAFPLIFNEAGYFGGKQESLHCYQTWLRIRHSQEVRKEVVVLIARYSQAVQPTKQGLGGTLLLELSQLEKCRSLFLTRHLWCRRFESLLQKQNTCTLIATDILRSRTLCVLSKYVFSIFYDNTCHRQFCVINTKLRVSEVGEPSN